MSEDVDAMLSGALEDYLETIYLLMQEHPFARVRDIAKARDVKPGSVTPALKRLADLDLVKYAQREYVTLTSEGERIARKVLSRHHLLTRFFTEVLELSPKAAERDACAMEHSLSDEAMDGLVRFFEFLGACRNTAPDFLTRFHGCSRVHEGIDHCELSCKDARELERERRNLHNLDPGETAKVSQVKASGALRQRLLDIGILPGSEATLERVAPGGDSVWILLDGVELELDDLAAKAVLLE